VSGAIFLFGVDAEDTAGGHHGDPSEWAEIFTKFYAEASEERSGLLALGSGKPGLPQPETFYDDVASLMDQTPSVTHVYEGAIAGQSFDGFAMVAIISSSAWTLGGLTETEDQLVVGRRTALSQFVLDGGVLVIFAQRTSHLVANTLSNFGFSDQNVATMIAGDAYGDLSGTEDGLLFDITDSNLDLPGRHWHEVYLDLPDHFRVLAIHDDPDAPTFRGEAAVIGLWGPHFDEICLPTPDLLTGGLRLWLEAKSLVGKYTEGGVSLGQWFEAGSLDGAGADDTQVVANSDWNPRFRATDGPCGGPAVRYDINSDGVSDRLRTASRWFIWEDQDDSMLATKDAFTWLGLGRLTTIAGDAKFYLAHDEDTFQAYLETVGGVARAVIRVLEDTGGVGTWREFSWSYVVGQWALLEVCLRNGALMARLNDSAVQVVSFDGLKVVDGNSLWVGQFASGTIDDIADLVAMFIYNVGLTSAQLSSLRTDYLECRYPCLELGIPVEPPGLFRFVDFGYVMG
jgi:hypothetical protein